MIPPVTDYIRTCPLITVSLRDFLTTAVRPLCHQDDKTESQTQVRADLTILDILAIDDTSGVFKLFYTLELRWTDLNLNFCDLHQDENYNILREVSILFSSNIHLSSFIVKLKSGESGHPKSATFMWPAM